MTFISAIKPYKVVLATFAVQLALMALFHVTLLVGIQQWLHHTGEQTIGFWLLVFALAVPLLSLGILSSTLLALMAGYFLGWESLYYYLPCYAASSYIGYQIISVIDQGKTIQLLQDSKRLKRALSFLELYPFTSVLFLRLSPVISFGQLTALCSFIRLNIIQYLFASTLGMIPRTLLAIWCGLYIRQHQGTLTDYQLPESYTPFIIALFILSVAGILYTLKRSFSKSKVLS
ncbi:MAG: associated Golgi protein-like protein [Cytophagaceae bacterium]|jgi:uncharacterized membrane protein YdjX (TVP38/TMEM64 family)|nr:associated Golgi protein-like protein [Cytophagaceae bacterium]